MSARADAFARAAEALIGTPFALHGRCPQHGLDCVGLVACALADCGIAPRIPEGYGLRNANIARFLVLAHGNGFDAARTPKSGQITRGDLLLVTPGPAQSHLLIALRPDYFVHAHAGLRRVAVHNGPLGWPIEHHWRLRAS
ncbi:NlpC/P60 family protein [Qipengyuania sp. 902]|uniref:NlpC/P60 family protein n=1 Tax=Qipengyuania sp. 902 TaxID=3417565 RepID=UPI003EB961C4